MLQNSVGRKVIIKHMMMQNNINNVDNVPVCGQQMLTISMCKWIEGAAKE
jgi:hypothetical protein